MDRFSKGKRFGGGGRSFGGGRDGGRQDTFKATCSDCGQECELPFKPTGDRPVFCNNCFKKQGGGNDKPSRFGGRDQRRDRPSFENKQMHDAVCSKCGSKCQVPFRPTHGKQVFCDKCFDKGGVSAKGGSDNSAQFKMLNEKLDKLIKLLSPNTPEIKTAKIIEEKPAKTVKPAKSATAKKAVKKEKPVKKIKITKAKPVAKKATAKKKK